MSSGYRLGTCDLLVTLSDWPAGGISHRERPFQKHVYQHFLGGSADKSGARKNVKGLESAGEEGACRGWGGKRRTEAHRS